MKSEYLLLQLLKAMRQRAGTLGELYKTTDISPKTLSVYLKSTDDDELVRDIRRPNYDAILRGAAVLGIKAGEFLRGRKLWDPLASYRENFTNRVDDIDAAPILEPVPRRKLGVDLSSCFGCAASVVTAESSRIRYVATRCCDVNTFKTVRSGQWPSIDPPNFYYCERLPSTEELDGAAGGQLTVHVTMGDHHVPLTVANLNKFGAPCGEDWAAEYNRSLEFIDRSHQILILSIVGTDWSGSSDRAALLRDWLKVAAMARSAGAKLCELNFACPSSAHAERTLHGNVEFIREVCSEIHRSVPQLQLIVKSGRLSYSAAHSLVRETHSFVAGYSAINSIPCRGLVSRSMILGELEGGLSGSIILSSGLTTIRYIRSVLKQLGLRDHVLIGVGGVTSPTDVVSYLEAGADLVQAATVFIEDSNFGIRVRSFLLEREQRIAVGIENLREKGRRTWNEAFCRLEDLPDLSGGSSISEIQTAALQVRAIWLSRLERDALAGPRKKVKPPTEGEWIERIQDRLRGNRLYNSRSKQ